MELIIPVQIVSGSHPSPIPILALALYVFLHDGAVDIRVFPVQPVRQCHTAPLPLVLSPRHERDTRKNSSRPFLFLVGVVALHQKPGHLAGVLFGEERLRILFRAETWLLAVDNVGVLPAAFAGHLGTEGEVFQLAWGAGAQRFQAVPRPAIILPF
ncbi:hypothetical protein PG996_013459 [Apiospora saccharicola]|uniref:Uncharacterized protein n=1 Tax=Apiospora saccharicola TaxID=335842 RepID=A0ABR1U5L9_9PEZI